VNVKGNKIHQNNNCKSKKIKIKQTEGKEELGVSRVQRKRNKERGGREKEKSISVGGFARMVSKIGCDLLGAEGVGGGPGRGRGEE
jgi:hypothetical protein